MWNGSWCDENKEAHQKIHLAREENSHVINVMQNVKLKTVFARTQTQGTWETLTMCHMLQRSHWRKEIYHRKKNCPGTSKQVYANKFSCKNARKKLLVKGIIWNMSLPAKTK